MCCVALGKLTGGISDWILPVEQKQILHRDIRYRSNATVFI